MKETNICQHFSGHFLHNSAQIVLPVFYGSGKLDVYLFYDKYFINIFK